MEYKRPAEKVREDTYKSATITYLAQTVEDEEKSTEEKISIFSNIKSVLLRQ